MGSRVWIPRRSPRSPAAVAPVVISRAMNRFVMVFSCGDWKPGHHLGIKIPRIGLPLLGLYPRMNAEESGSRIPKMGRRCQCRSTDLV